MKKNLLGILSLASVIAGLAAFGQSGNQPATPQAQGGQQAWCDKNGDGLCDVTGLPVDQNYGRMAGGAFCARGPGNGRGRGMSYGRGGGMGYGRVAGMNCRHGGGVATRQSAAQAGK